MAEQSHGSDLDLLLVSNEPESARRLRDACMQLGASTREATTVPLAYRAMEADEPDAIFIDLVSTGPRDSVSFVQHVRHRWPRVVFVLYNDEDELSAHAETLYFGWGARLRQYFTQPRTAADTGFFEALVLNLEHRVPLDLVMNEAEAAAVALTGQGYSKQQLSKLHTKARQVRRSLPPDASATSDSGEVSPHAFVIRAFNEALDDAYEHGIAPALQTAGLHVRVATDEYASAEPLIHKIFRFVRECQLVIADLSIARPNCFYELGFADALEKPTVLVARHGTKIPLDLAGREVIFYGNSSQLRPKVEKAIRDARRETPH